MESKPKFLDGKVGFVLVAGGIAVLFIGVAFLGFYFGGAFDQSSCPAGDATVGAATAERCAEDCANEGAVEVKGRRHVCAHPGITVEERQAVGCDDPVWMDPKLCIPLYLPGNVNQQSRCLCRGPNMDYQPIW
jgi:hypothetical protein